MFFVHEQSQMMKYADLGIFWTINTLLIYEFSMGLFYNLNLFKLRKWKIGFVRLSLKTLRDKRACMR